MVSASFLIGALITTLFIESAGEAVYTGIEPGLDKVALWLTSLDEQERVAFVEAAMLVALADGEISSEEIKTIEGALGTDLADVVAQAVEKAQSAYAENRVAEEIIRIVDTVDRAGPLARALWKLRHQASDVEAAAKVARLFCEAAGWEPDPEL